MSGLGWRVWLAIGIAMVLVAALVPPASAQTPHPWLRPPNHPGAPKFYKGQFADPSIVRVGGTYVAFASNTGGSHLPVMTSNDLRNWSPLMSYNRTTSKTRASDSSSFLPDRPIHVARQADRAFDPWINDGLLDIHPGAKQDITDHNHLRSGYWAPGVAKIGSRFVAYSSVPQSTTDHRCIRVSVSANATGPFSPVSGNKWLQCDHQARGVARSPNGSNDPDPFIDADGTPYLIWKSEGNPNPPFTPTVLWARRLNKDGTGFAPGSVRRELLRTERPWEGNIIENPSMVKFRGKHYLFYSGNRWQDSSYGTGYAICDGPLGPCKRKTLGPLMSSNNRFVGPGGADAFVDADGNLRLAFHHWLDGTQATRPATAYRAMAVARVTVNKDGGLRVGGFVTPPPVPTPGPSSIPALPNIPKRAPALNPVGNTPPVGLPPPSTAPASPRQS